MRHTRGLFRGQVSDLKVGDQFLHNNNQTWEVLEIRPPKDSFTFVVFTENINLGTKKEFIFGKEVVLDLY